MTATATELCAALERRHDAKEWWTFREVTVDIWGHRADFLALNKWQSRGYALHGYEVKVSRGDWLRELKQPDKAETIASHCAAWSIATVPGVVEVDELPLGWGLLEWSGKRWKVVVKPLVGPAAEMPRMLWVALMRSIERPGQREVQEAFRRGQAAATERYEEAEKHRAAAAVQRERETDDAARLLGFPRWKLADPEWCERVRTLINADDMEANADRAIRQYRDRLTRLLESAPDERGVA